MPRAPRAFDDFLDAGYPTGIPDNKLVEILEEGSSGWQRDKVDWRIDRQRTIPGNPVMNVYAIQPNKDEKNKNKKFSRAKISGGTKGGNSYGIGAQILVPKGVTITAQQARDAFRASMVSNEFGKTYHVEVDAEGGYTVDETKIS